MNGLYSHSGEFDSTCVRRRCVDGTHGNAVSVWAADKSQPFGSAQASHSAAAISAIAGTTRILSSVALIACSDIVPFQLAITPPPCRWNAARRKYDLVFAGRSRWRFAARTWS